MGVRTEGGAPLSGAGVLAGSSSMNDTVELFPGADSATGSSTTGAASIPTATPGTTAPSIPSGWPLVRGPPASRPLRGVELVGHATLVEDWDTLWKIGSSVFERYMGPVTPETEPLVERTLNKRVGFLLDPDRTVSWDHRKLAGPR